MMNGILCATDFSISSREAIKWSIRLAEKLKTHLTILYTYRLLKQNGEALDFKRKMESDAIKNFGLLKAELLSGTTVSFDFKIEVGFIDDRIEEHSRNNKISFLVMGKSMTVRNKEIFDELIDHLHTPLVIVPETIE